MFGDDILFLQRFLSSIGCYHGKLDGDYGPLTEAALHDFESQCEQIAGKHGRFDMRTESCITTLQPEAQIQARKFMNALKEAPLNAKIISGTRTYQEQNDLYAMGRTKPGKIVTKARGGFSNHNFGIAWDIGIFDGTKYLDDSPLYSQPGNIGKTLGLEWGGDWNSIVDLPHFQLKLADSTNEIRDKFEQGASLV
jgi:peptidoglycan L-alanyl-D-glutamate endopeptidase CwlK